MQQLTVTVKRLNKRKLVPVDLSDRSTIIGTVTEGYSFAGTEADVTEVPNQALGKWYKDRDGYFYWGGGVEETLAVPFTLPAETILGVLDYNSNSLLPAVTKKTRGDNITIGIVDTGCFIHEAFKNNTVIGKNFIDNNDDFEDTSAQSHGTFVSGIIIAGETIDNQMKGIAPAVKLVIAKATTQSGISNRNALLEGLKWVIEQKPDIINCSFDFSPSTDSERFKNIFTSADAQKIIWVAAGQDNSGLFNQNVFYPASLDNFIAVGSLRPDALGGSSIDKINPKIKYIMGEGPFISTNRFDLYSHGVGSSFASALVAGSLALIKAHLIKTQHASDPKDCVNFLDEHIEQLTTAQQLNTAFSIYKR